MPTMFESPCLDLHGFGFAFGERTVVRAIDMRVPSRGLFTLLGPVAAGKSALLRLLSGEINASTCQSWGTAVYSGAPLGERGRPALAGQRARHVIGTLFEMLVERLAARDRLTRMQQRDTIRQALTELGLRRLSSHLDTPLVELGTAEQRAASVVRACLTGRPMICADEPTSGLDERGRALVLGLLERMAERRSVFFVTHNLNDVRALGGDLALLAGGLIQEQGRVEDFLRSPSSDAGRQFLRTGSCAVPSPDAVAEEICPPPSERTIEPRPATRPANQGAAAAMKWVIPGRLAGVCRPGLLRDLSEDLGALAAAGVKLLVCLEERQTVDQDAIRRHGMEPVWLPVPDMEAPPAGVTRWLCERLKERIDGGDAVAIHCRGGVGRTGTVLAAYFIWRGASAPEAMATIRRVDAGFVQSTAQIEFLRRFASLNQQERGSLRVAG